MPRKFPDVAATLLLLVMLVLAGGAALRESVTVDEVAHIGAGLSYLQRLDLRMNPEHPPLAKALAALPLALRGAHADYSSNTWKLAETFFPAYLTQWMFGDAVLGRWNDWKSTLMWARAPMLILTLLLGWIVYVYASRFGGLWGGLLCLSVYVTTPAFLTFGPLAITDVPVTLFSLIALWQLAEIWVHPSRSNALRFGLALAASLLSKFTGLLLLPVILAFFIQTRFWPLPSEPKDKVERKAWRRARLRSVLRGLLWAALTLYLVYLILSWNQSNDALNRVGSGPWAGVVRRPLMPIWLYLRGLILMLLMASRPTFILGRDFPHGEPFYFPIVFALKSTLGFLLLLAFTAIAGILRWRRSKQSESRVNIIPAVFRPHWRVLMVGFFVFLAVCLLSRLDISVRHFLIPVILLILMLAPLPKMLDRLPGRKVLNAAATALVAACFIAVLGAYPYFFPFVNSLAFGHPAFSLLNDSNVTWNEALPAVADFAQQQKLTRVPIDWASLSDPALVVPQAEPWDCQTPAGPDAGQWVVVTAVSILENRNCGYLLQYPRRELAGGAMFAVHLPAAALTSAPLPAARKKMWGMPIDLRAICLNGERHPDQLPTILDGLMRSFQQSAQPNGSGKTR